MAYMHMRLYKINIYLGQIQHLLNAKFYVLYYAKCFAFCRIRSVDLAAPYQLATMAQSSVSTTSHRRRI
jgi:hypothetical protein